MKKLAIIGASYLQRPLVEKASSMGLETHVFAWKEGNVVDDIADFYYPVSILEKEEILKKCAEISIDGITSIASDIAMPTVNYVASKLGLVGNTIEATKISTDKFEMRKALLNAGIPCPQFLLFENPNFEINNNLSFPVIVKPTDRSGSRGVTKVENPINVNNGIAKAIDNSIGGKAIVEEFIEGREFSVEMISWKGEHFHLAITDKVTTGAPYFVEIEHHQPADIDNVIEDKIVKSVKNALSALKIENGASHSEVLLTPGQDIKLIEVAGRMGGDLIGSDVTSFSTGYDFIRGAIQVALGVFNPTEIHPVKKGYSGVYYVLPESGIITAISDYSSQYEFIKKAIPILNIGDEVPDVIDGAGNRAGIINYYHKNHKLNIDPRDILKFDTE